MQCPIMSYCLMSPKFVFLGIGCLGFALGFLSAARPMRSIALYQWIMERFNWKVAPIDLAREVRNTRILGLVLVALSLATFVIASHRF
jgi:hypothetical protein